MQAPEGCLLLAGINRIEVVQKGAVRVHGVAAANAMKSANLEIAQGDSPYERTRIRPAREATAPTRYWVKSCGAAEGRQGLATKRGVASSFVHFAFATTRR